MEGSDKTWTSKEITGKPLQYSCLENPMNSMERQKDMTLKGMRLVVDWVSGGGPGVGMGVGALFRGGL